MKLPSSSPFGFTLVELLIVITIIALLAIGAISAVNPIEQINKANDANATQMATNVMHSLYRYYSATQQFPWSSLSSAEQTAVFRYDNIYSGVNTDNGTLITVGDLRAKSVLNAARSRIFVGGFNAIAANPKTFYVCYIPTMATVKKGNQAMGEMVNGYGYYLLSGCSSDLGGFECDNISVADPAGGSPQCNAVSPTTGQWNENAAQICAMCMPSQ